jgi:hypothetical protein
LGGLKTNEAVDNEKVEKAEEEEIHHQQHERYMLADIFRDLLAFSAQHLVDSGRLVYWLPIYLELDRTQIK